MLTNNKIARLLHIMAAFTMVISVVIGIILFYKSDRFLTPLLSFMFLLILGVVTWVFGSILQILDDNRAQMFYLTENTRALYQKLLASEKKEADDPSAVVGG